MTNDKIAESGPAFETTFRDFLVSREFDDHEAIVFTKMASRFLSDWADAMANASNLQIHEEEIPEEDSNATEEE